MEDFFDTCTKDEIIAQWQDGQCEIERLARELEEESARAEAAEAKAKLCDSFVQVLRHNQGSPQRVKEQLQAALADYDALEEKS